MGSEIKASSVGLAIKVGVSIAVSVGVGGSTIGVGVSGGSGVSLDINISVISSGGEKGEEQGHLVSGKLLWLTPSLPKRTKSSL